MLDANYLQTKGIITYWTTLADLRKYSLRPIKPHIAIAVLILLSIVVAYTAYHLLSSYMHKRQAPKIFQIGFNKCGTTTLYNFFQNNGIRSIHNDAGKLASSIHSNYSNNKKLLSKKYEQHQAFFDMENVFEHPPKYIYLELYKELDKQYPGSKFILNTRDKQAWLRSRARHYIRRLDKDYLDKLADQYQLTKIEMLEQWEREWDQHQNAVIEYFKNRPNDLLVFNIDTDSPNKLVAFFKDMQLDPSLYKHTDPSQKSPLKPVKIIQISSNIGGENKVARFMSANKLDIAAINALELQEVDSKYPGSKYIFSANSVNVSEQQLVLDYFNDRPNDLLVFNVETDQTKKLCNFFIQNYILSP